MSGIHYSLAAALFTAVLIGVGLSMVPDDESAASSAPVPSVDVDAMVALWKTGTRGRRQVRELVRTPEEEMLVVRALIAEASTAGPDTCALLSDAGGRRWCDGMRRRPHLYEQGPAGSPDRTRSGGGPVDTRLLASVPLMDHAPAEPVPTCTSTSDRQACAAEVATAASLAANADGVRAACLHIDEGRWRDECMFMAAERMFVQLGEDTTAPAAWLCARAGRFAPHCLNRIIGKLAARTPPADTPGDWSQVLHRAGALQVGLGESDSLLAAHTVNRFYAEALDRAYSTAATINGLPLTVVPVDYHHHVRAAAIDRLVRLDPEAESTAPGWLARIDEALAGRGAGGSRLSPESVQSQLIQDLWRTESAEEAAVRAVFWRGSARRLWTRHSDDDRLVCLLESLARTKRPPVDLFGVLSHHDDPAVRLTARRVLRSLGRL